MLTTRGKHSYMQLWATALLSICLYQLKVYALPWSDTAGSRSVPRTNTGVTTVDVLIVGGGAAGSSIGLKLYQEGVDFLLVESEGELGGKVVSRSKDGFQWEEGPHTIRVTDSISQLIMETHLSDEVLLSEKRLPRYVLWDHQLKQMMSIPQEVVWGTYLSKMQKLRLLTGIVPLMLFNPKSVDSIKDHYVSYIGKENFEKLIDPFISGVYAGDPETLSACVLLNRYPLTARALVIKSKNLLRSIRRYPSNALKLLRMKRSSKFVLPKNTQISLTNGLHQIFDGITTTVGSDKILLNHKLTSVSYIDGFYHATVEAGKAVKHITAKSIVLAVPAFEAARLTLPLLGKEVSAAINSTQYAPVTVVTLAYPTDSFLHPFKGFGYLIPRQNGLHTLGVIWYSSIFPQKSIDGYHIITAFVGGMRNPNVIRINDVDMVNQVDEELRIGFLKRESPPPKVLGIKRWEYAIPQFTVQSASKMSIVQNSVKRQKGFYLAGDYVSGVSLGKIVEASKQIGDDIKSYLTIQSSV